MINTAIYIFVFFLQQSLIMNEKVDKERDKQASLCRRAIKQTLSDAYASRPALRPKRTLAREIAFAKEIILKRGRADRRVALRRPKGKRRVRWLHESVSPLDTGASTSNSNTKGYRKWKVRREQWNPHPRLTTTFKSLSEKSFKSNSSLTRPATTFGSH